MAQPTGYVFYRGASMIDSEPIVGIAVVSSRNQKTGDMVQCYIFRDNDKTPFDNARDGTDVSVCGDCAHRRTGEAGDCYVNLLHGPRAVWNAYKAGKYPERGAYNLGFFIVNRKVRLGAYGDPFAIPQGIWAVLLRYVHSWTGYTQAWKHEHFPRNSGVMNYCMASCDSVAEWVMAREQGYRTYRIRRSVDEPLMSTEFVCPASDEKDHARQCVTCMACNGNHDTGKASPVIVVHGSFGRK